jgi:hypothetical protein
MPENCPVNITPYSQSGTPKSPNIVSLNYTNQDFWPMKTRLVQYTRERFGPDGTVLPNTFNDFVESSLAVMLIENWAYIADTQCFKLDQVANELFIDSVTEVENAFRLSRLVGFAPQPPIAARSMWSATINMVRTTDVTVQTPLEIALTANGEPITVELFQADANGEPLFDSPILVPAGQTVNSSIVGLEGKTYVETLTGNGEVSQMFTLSYSPVIYDSVQVEVDGQIWEQVSYFTDSQPRREYRFEQDSDYKGYLVFGNNRAGLIPSLGSKIRVRYRVGGGSRGNIITGFADVTHNASVSGIDYTVPIVFTNYTRGQYGYDGDTIEDIRRKLPMWLRSQDRAVSGEDYKTLTDQFSTAYHGQIGKSTAVLRHHGCAGNVVDIYILARDGANDLEKASNGLKVALMEELYDKKMATDFVCIRDGVVISVDISIELTLDKFQKKFQEEVRARVEQKLASFFSINNWEYGQTLRAADVIRELSDIEAIDTYEITFVTSDPNNSGEVVTSKYYEIIRPDQITISFIYT